MDWWIVKQLRAMVLEDLRDFVPQGYFESEAERFKFYDGIKISAHFSSELRWGYLAGKLGKRLIFESTAIMSARQVSASEVLMNLGVLAAAEAAQGVTTQLSKDAKEAAVSDGNAGAVAEQLGHQQIPTLSNNVIGALEQYLRYLTPLEAAPFSPLLISVPFEEGIEDKTTDEQPNIRLLINRMTIALDNSDPSGVLHASASIFETMAKGIIGIDAIQDQTLASFFERYRKDSGLPEEVLDYILSIYKRRNTEPLAGHGSTKSPNITKQEAIILAELTRAFVKIERQLHVMNIRLNGSEKITNK